MRMPKHRSPTAGNCSKDGPHQAGRRVSLTRTRENQLQIIPRTRTQQVERKVALLALLRRTGNSPTVLAPAVVAPGGNRLHSWDPPDEHRKRLQPQRQPSLRATFGPSTRCHGRPWPDPRKKSPIGNSVV
jgi:hypothetical protein